MGYPDGVIGRRSLRYLGIDEENTATRSESEYVCLESRKGNFFRNGVILTSSSDTDHIQYDISIMDVAGQDHSENFQVLGSSSESTGSGLQKRAYSRPLDHCPDDEVFTQSYCREETSPQAYVLICANGDDPSWYFRRCAEREICVGGIPKQNPPLPNGQLVPPTLKAYCVSMDFFIRVANSRASLKTVPATVRTEYSAPKGRLMAMAAVLTGQNISESIFASSLRMSAQTSDTSNNVQHWRSQVGGTAVCTDCARISIGPVPEKTQRFVINVVLDAASVGGLLFLSQIAM
ncbi:MAG: hypothetical protein Q9166_003935 [cf. Caloplaca sp. 2 TL-2023]